MQTQLLKNKYDTNYKYFEVMSKDIYNIYTNNEKIINIFAQVKDANEYQRALLRENLYKLLKKRYKRLRNMGIDQVQFHLPDNTSFLRMNNPALFGDNLSSFRESVALTNKDKRVTDAFEIGRSNPGFRFVYPLYDSHKKHLGSVEISYASQKIIELVKNDFIYDIHILISKDIATKQLTSANLHSLYRKTWESKEYLLEKNSHTKAGDINLHLNEKNTNLQDEINQGILSNKPFSLIAIHNYNSIVLSFIPMGAKNHQKAPAYLVTYMESDYLGNLEIEYEYTKVLFLSIVFLLYLFLIFIIFNREKLKKMAHFDDLTKLPNRVLFSIEFENEINRAQRYKTKMALLFLDLDGFKAVNDTFGHDIGDELLKDVSLRLENSVRKSDIVSRVGGDEFILLLTDIKNSDEALEISNNIIKELNKEFLINKNLINVGASIGVSIFPEDGDNKSTLMKKADIMMYEAKNTGKNKVVLFSKEKDV